MPKNEKDCDCARIREEDDKCLKAYIFKTLPDFEISAELEDTRFHDGDDGFFGVNLIFSSDDENGSAIHFSYNSDDGPRTDIHLLTREALMEIQAFLSRVLITLDVMQERYEYSKLKAPESE